MGSWARCWREAHLLPFLSRRAGRAAQARGHRPGFNQLVGAGSECPARCPVLFPLTLPQSHDVSPGGDESLARMTSLLGSPDIGFSSLRSPASPPHPPNLGQLHFPPHREAQGRRPRPSAHCHPSVSLPIVCPVSLSRRTAPPPPVPLPRLPITLLWGVSLRPPNLSPAPDP